MQKLIQDKLLFPDVLWERPLNIHKRILGKVLVIAGSRGMAGAAWAVLYTGLLSVGLGYTLQIFGQRSAPPADAAILLSTEAVFAALAGWWFLGETLSTVQLLGCGIMLAGMLLAQGVTFHRRRRAVQ